MTVDGGARLEVYGDIAPDRAAYLYGDVITLRSSALISPGYTGSDVSSAFVFGGEVRVRGDIRVQDEVRMRAESLDIRAGSHLVGDDLRLSVDGPLIHRGTLDGEYVTLDTVTYRLYRGAEILADYGCRISGAPHPRSRPAPDCE